MNGSLKKALPGNASQNLFSKIFNPSKNNLFYSDTNSRIPDECQNRYQRKIHRYYG